MYWQITVKLNRGLCLATMHISFDCHLFLLRIINAGNDAWHPADEGKEKHDEHRAAAAVNHRQRRKDDG